MPFIVMERPTGTLPVADIVASFPERMSIFHVGSCALIPVEDQDLWLQVVVAAKDRGALISIDPNCTPVDY